MSICLCMDTGERVLNLIALRRLEILGRGGLAELEDCGTNARETRAVMALLGIVNQTVHLLVRDAGRRSRRTGTVSHVWNGPVPTDSLIQVAPGVFVASPEFNALLMMRGRRIMHRPQILMSYCGLFSVDESSEDGFVKRVPLTTTRRLREFALGMRGEPCAEAMLEALELTLDRARSPMEVRLALIMVAPRFQGGFGLVQPELNAELMLNEEGKSIWDFDSIEGDIVWRRWRLILEYNGKLRHEGRYAEDLTRANALRASGYEVMLVSSQQLRSARQMLVIGEWLYDGMGLSKDGLPGRERLQELINDVMSYETPHYAL